MDRIERKARELMRSRQNRICDTCRHKTDDGNCEVTPDINACKYNDYELWKPNSQAFVQLAERVLSEY